MIDKDLNREAMGKVFEVSEMLKDTDISPKEETRLMFEQLLRGLSLVY